ncbi:hypothetical protein [Streptomyces luteogriseus]|uniref:hypothetical protein n=1 Tax=Streptomyces luteogriseus TaxID=68233 RepID=UPI00262936F6|nr:hypothetical protein [uncultured Streptomyces sp.]
MKPDAEVTIALATSVMAYGAYQMALPTTADIRSLEPDNADIQGAERAAAWVAAGGVSLVALLTKSPAVFTLGGATVVAASWMTRHADRVDTVTKKASSLVPGPAAKGPQGVVGDEVAAVQQLPSTPVYGVAV